MADQEQGVTVPIPPPVPMQTGQQAQKQKQQQIHVAPQAPTTAPTAQQLGQQIAHMNWSYFKPEFSGKLDEGTEAHLLCTNDLMNAHHFIEGVKVQIFCLTLLGEARLWYQSLEPINVDWQGLQNSFRQQYSNIGNTRNNYFMYGDLLVLMKIQKE